MSLFSSGQWVGFYTYKSLPKKFMMDLVLEFKNGFITGEGHDGIGGFVIAGVYSTATQECAWQKTYVGRHTVEYRGFGEDKSIWGTWTLSMGNGGFKIWPLAEDTPLAALEEEDKESEIQFAPAPA